MIIHEIKADLARRGCNEIIHLTQGDTASHMIRFKITKNGLFWKPPAGLQALIHYSNTYGSGGTYDTLADGTPAWYIAEHDLCVLLIPQAMALPGSVHVVVTLLYGEEALSAFHIQLMVDGLAAFSSPVLANYSNITEFLPRPDTAEAGQFFAAETVTDSGKVLTVMAADAPSSGGSFDDSMIPTAVVTETENGARITISDHTGTTTATVTNGVDGITPHIGSNHNWFVGSTDTGVKAAGADGKDGTDGKTGADGKSAYQYALEGGYSGTEAEFTQKMAAEGYGYVAQPEPPADTHLLWLDTDDASTDGNAAQPDWNASEGEPGHILNRTHYEHLLEILPETALVVDEENNIRIPQFFTIDSAKTYLINLNGKGMDYLILPVEDGSDVLMMALLDEGIPVCIILPGTFISGDASVMDVMLMSDMDPSSCHISISEQILVKIPEKFLPDKQKTYVIDVPTDSIIWHDSDLADLTGSVISYDAFIDILFGGGDVFVKTDALVTSGLAEDVVSSGVFGRVISYYWYGNDTQGLLFLQAYGRSKAGGATNLITFEFTGTKQPPMV